MWCGRYRTQRSYFKFADLEGRGERRFHDDEDEDMGNICPPNKSSSGSTNNPYREHAYKSQNGGVAGTGGGGGGMSLESNSTYPIMNLISGGLANGGGGSNAKNGGALDIHFTALNASSNQNTALLHRNQLQNGK